MIKVCCMPVNLVVAVLAGSMTKKNAFTYELLALISLVLVCSYTVLFTLGTFPAKEDQTYWTHIHVIAVTAVYDLVLNFEFVTNFAIIMKIADRRISGMHVTLLGVLSNMSEFVHKFYLFALVEAVGIFIPQTIFLGIAVFMIIILGKRFKDLDDEHLSTWHLSEDCI